MAQLSSRTIVVHTGAETASGSSGDIILPVGFTSIIAMVNTTAASGTTPALNLFIQQRVFDAATGNAVGTDATGTKVYDDYAAFAQITATGKRFLRVVGGGGQGATQDTAASDAALTAGTVRNGSIGDAWRLKWTIAGTSPSFTFTFVVVFIP